MKVVIAFIQNHQAQFLITQRAQSAHYGGYWELPGGKIELGESPLAALKRELKEELNYDILDAECFAQVELEAQFYLFHLVYALEPVLQVGQIAYAWVNIEELQQYHFPPSNHRFFTAWQEFFMMD